MTVFHNLQMQKQKVTLVQCECTRLSEQNKALQSENLKLRGEEVVDVQCRLMRENLDVVCRYLSKIGKNRC